MTKENRITIKLSGAKRPRIEWLKNHLQMESYAELVRHCLDARYEELQRKRRSK